MRLLALSRCFLGRSMGCSLWPRVPPGVNPGGRGGRNGKRTFPLALRIGPGSELHEKKAGDGWVSGSGRSVIFTSDIHGRGCVSNEAPWYSIHT